MKTMLEASNRTFRESAAWASRWLICGIVMAAYCLMSSAALAARGFLDLDELNGNTGFVVQGSAGDGLGKDLEILGDFNGDGFDDICVVSGRVTASQFYGSVTLIQGRRTGGFALPSKIYIPSIAPYKGFTLWGGYFPAQWLGNISKLGDMNGDTLADLHLAGEHYAIGRAYPMTSRLWVNGGAPIHGINQVAPYPDISYGLPSLGDSPKYWEYPPVSSDGDFNGDGYLDLLVGTEVLLGSPTFFSPAENWDSVVPYAWSIFETLGGNALLPDMTGDGLADIAVGWTDATYLGNPTAAIVVIAGSREVTHWSATDLNGTNGFFIVGPTTGGGFGTKLASIGDFNGDGLSDLVVGVPALEQNGADSGAAYVIFGRTTAFPIVLNVSDLDGSNGFMITGSVAGDMLGTVVSTAGDFNGDGLDDILVTAPGDGPENQGASYLIFGTRETMPSNFDVADVDGYNGWKIGGRGTAGALTGTTATGGGDFNGDGYDDILIGAPVDDNDGTDSGRVYVVFGFPSRPVVYTHSPRKVSFRDKDGDTVVVTTSKGSLSAGDFYVYPAGFGRLIVDRIDLSDDGAEFQGADISIVALRGRNGDGFVNIDFLDAHGVDLGRVNIDGTLARMESGDGGLTGFGLKSLSVRGLGLNGLADDPAGAQWSDVTSGVHGNVGNIRVAGDWRTGWFYVWGTVRNVSIGGHFDGTSGLSITGQTPFSPSRVAPLCLRNFTVRGSFYASSLHVGVAADFGGAPIGGDVRVGTVKVLGDWVRGRLAVGVIPGPDNLFGTDDDELSNNGGNPLLRSEIGSVYVRGKVEGTPEISTDLFGITSEAIRKARFGSNRLPMSSGADYFYFTEAPDVVIREIEP